MLHNESVNVWTHLFGMIIFTYIIAHTHQRYEPSDFYYHSVHLNNNNSLSLYDFGVPFQKLLTSELLDKTTSMDFQKITKNITYFPQVKEDGIDQTLKDDVTFENMEEDSYYSYMLEYILSSSHLDQM